MLIWCLYPFPFYSIYFYFTVNDWIQTDLVVHRCDLSFAFSFIQALSFHSIFNYDYLVIDNSFYVSYTQKMGCALDDLARVLLSVCNNVQLIIGWYFSSLCFSFVIKFVVCECVVHPNHRLWSNNKFLAYCRIRLNTSIRINLIIQTDNRFDQRNTLWLHMIPLVRTNMCFSHAFQSNKVIQLRCPNVAGEREISETDMGKMCKHILKALGGACCVLLLLLINK